MSARPTLSIPVRDVRIRLARDDIHMALSPVSRHSEAAMLCLELDDDDGLEHHLRHVVDGVRLAALKHRELRSHLSSLAALETVETLGAESGGKAIGR
jgi:hypothetical protein